jgi:hypothetical protein
MEHSVALPARNKAMGTFVFLMLSFPFGLLSFLVTVIGLSLGLGTLVIWIGLPILFITLLSIHGMAEMERRMVSSLLGISVNYRWRAEGEPVKGFLRRFGGLLRDPYTWTGMIYMLLKLPLGMLNFTVALVFTLLSACLTFLPLVYLLNAFIDGILLKNGISGSSILIPFFIEIHGSFDPLMFARSFVGVPLGVLLWIATRYLLTGLGLFSGELAKALLGPGMVSAHPHADWHSAPSPIMQVQQVQRANVD